MIYVFVFLGEFGYELLNWQGVVRKYKKIHKNDKIVVASRRGLNLLYESVNLYVDISNLELFKKSIATGYGCNSPNIKLYKDYDRYVNNRITNGTYSFGNFVFKHRLKKQIKKYVDMRIEKKFGLCKEVKYIFSDECTCLGNLQFGRKHRDKHDIYANLDINNNEYVKLSSNEDNKDKVEKLLGMSLSNKYVLCQMGSRSIVRRSKVLAKPEQIIGKLSQKCNVILLDFKTGRNMDSGSKFEGEIGCRKYVCQSFEEQSLLIANSNCCVFFTEGDFRSHNYLPPFFGKNVYSLADKEVYELPTTPIDFWNKNVFKFGGQIFPVYTDQLMNENYLNSFINNVVKNV